MTDLDKSPAQPYVIETTGPTIGPVPNYTIPSGGGGGAPGGVSGNVQYNQSGVFGGLTDIQLTAKIQPFSPTLSGAVPSSGGGTVNFLRADGTFAPPTQGSGVVTYSQIQNVSASPRALGNVSGGAGPVTELTGTNLATFIDLFTTSTRGQVPASGGGATNFLRADGVWVSPGSSGLPGGVSGQFQFNNAGSFAGVTMSGDATWSSGSGILTVSANAITYAKMQNIASNNVVLGNVAGASSPVVELTPTQLTTLVNVFTSSLSGAVPSSGGGTVNFLRADGTWVPPPGGSGGTPGGALNTIQWNSAGSFAGFSMNGDATLVPSTGVITIANSAVTYAKIQNVSIGPAFLGRSSSGAGVVQEVTPTQATAQLNVFTSTLQGVVPSSGGGTTNFLRADGTWIAPGGAGAPGGTNGQIQYNNASAFGGFTVGGDATLNTGSGVLTIANLAVTYAKMQNISANNRVLGNVSGAAGPVTELTPTQLTTQVNVFTNTLSGAAPASAGGTTNFLRADGSWAAPGGAGAPGGVTTNLQYNNAGAFGGMSGTAWDDTNRSLVTTGATVTAFHPLFDQTQTWNNAAITFTGARRINITDTASNINSLFDDLQVGGVSQWSLRKDGTVTVGKWGGTPIAAPQGGTGQFTYVIGDTLYASATTALSRLPGNTTTTRKFLRQVGSGTASAAPVWDTLLPSDTGMPATTVQGGYPVWSTTLGTITDGQGVINALAYGVSQSASAANNTTFLANALNTGKLVYIPQGTYNFSSTASVIASTSGIIGDSQRGTILNWTSTTGDCISIADGIFGVYIGNLTITRSSLATSGAGIKFNGTTIGNDFANIFNVRVFNHNIGLDLGGVSNAYITNVISVQNRSHGVRITGPAASGPIQWQMLNVFSEANGGDGFNIAGTGITPVGNWRGLAAFQNSGRGFAATGCTAIRLSDSFFGTDTSHEVYIGTGGDTNYDHLLTNVYTELSTSGNGFFFDTGLLGGVKLSNCAAVRNALSGLINNSGKNVMVDCGSYVGNGTANSSGNTYGLLNFASGSTMSAIGVRAPVTGSQTIGIVSISGTAACTTVGCNTVVSNSATLPSNTGNY